MNHQERVAASIAYLDKENARLEKEIEIMKADIVRRLLNGDVDLQKAIDKVIVENKAKLLVTERELKQYRIGRA